MKNKGPGGSVATLNKIPYIRYPTRILTVFVTRAGAWANSGYLRSPEDLAKTPSPQIVQVSETRHNASHPYPDFQGSPVSLRKIYSSA
jgi:hypothetical protein